MRLPINGLEDIVFNNILNRHSLFMFDFGIIYETINIQEFDPIYESIS